MYAINILDILSQYVHAFWKIILLHSTLILELLEGRWLLDYLKAVLSQLVATDSLVP